MTHVQQMVRTNPGDAPVDEVTIVECIEACLDCTQAYTACADACLGEEQVAELRRCIRLDLDCADICETTGRILSRQTAFEPQTARAQLEACAQACRVCGDECDRHAEMGMQHCVHCAEACRRCEQACNDVLSTIAA